MASTCVWVTSKGQHVGAELGRDRWFCLGWRTDSALQRFLQVVGPTNLCELEDLTQREWNPEARIAIEDALMDDFAEDTRNRLHVLGNIVVPQMAQYAAKLLCTL